LPYRFTAQARDDLRDIAAYTRDRWGDAQCDRYLTSLEWRCLQLAQEPRLRRPYDDDPSYWRALAGKHAVFYRVEVDGNYPGRVRSQLRALILSTSATRSASTLSQRM
jgi:toxin ParE1/3/4